MTNSFTKLFNSIITSSVWSEDDKTRIMWITMLASADAEGHVSGSIPGMAAVSRMTLEQADKSIKALCKPDPYSRTKEYEGRRLLECDGGWLIANYAKYREKRDPEIRRKQNREAKRRQRSQQKVSQSQPKSAQAEAEAEAYKRKDSSSKNGEFDVFWKCYPKKVGKGAARKVFERIAPSEQLLKKILSAVEQQKTTEQWRRDSGKYIPHPATWLNQERWDDEVEHKETTAEQVARMESEGKL